MFYLSDTEKLYYLKLEKEKSPKKGKTDNKETQSNEEVGSKEEAKVEETTKPKTNTSAEPVKSENSKYDLNVGILTGCTPSTLEMYIKQGYSYTEITDLSELNDDFYM